MRDQFILSLGFLAFEPTSAEVLAAGEWQLDAVFTSASTWALSAPLEIDLDARAERAPVGTEQLRQFIGRSRDGGLVFADGEVSRTVVAVRRGLGGAYRLEKCGRSRTGARGP